MMQKHFVVASSLVLGLMAFAGCGQSGLGQADSSKVPVVDPAVIQKELNREESTKHLPKGAKMPSNVMSENPPTK